MRFYVDDNNSVLYKFYDGQGITEDGSTSGVRYQNVHTHFVHWKSGNSIQFNALASGPHRIRFVLVDQSEVELPATTQTLAFTVVPGTGGAFSLQEVVGNLDFPVPMAPAPDVPKTSLRKFSKVRVSNGKIVKVCAATSPDCVLNPARIEYAEPVTLAMLIFVLKTAPNWPLA